MDVLNSVVVGALVFFVLTLAGLLWVVTALVPQITKTLLAYERLAGTLESELEPTLKEVQKVVVGISDLKSIAAKNVTDVSAKVEDVTGNLVKVTDTAKRSGHVWGAGLLAGAKAYLEGNKKSANSDHRDQHSKQVDKQITLSRGEKNG